jgi:hypothetical protein
MPRSTGPQQPPNPGVGLFVLAFFLSPFVLVAWFCGQALLRWTGWRGWRLGLPAIVGGALIVWIQGGPGPALAHHFAGLLALVNQFRPAHAAPAHARRVPVAAAPPGHPDRAAGGQPQHWPP